jgi:hypothetical protein
VRIIAAILVWVLFLGGMSLYMHAREHSDTVSIKPSGFQIAKDRYSLEITPTFSLQPDPFALQLDNDNTQYTLLVRMGKKEILKISDRMEAGAPIKIDPLEGVTVGYNELYIEASPSIELSSQSQAVRVRILRGNQSVFEKTIWTIPGGKAVDTVYFGVDIQSKEEALYEH